MRTILGKSATRTSIAPSIFPQALRRPERLGPVARIQPVQPPFLAEPIPEGEPRGQEEEQGEKRCAVAVHGVKVQRPMADGYQAKEAC